MSSLLTFIMRPMVPQCGLALQLGGLDQVLAAQQQAGVVGAAHRLAAAEGDQVEAHLA